MCLRNNQVHRIRDFVRDYKEENKWSELLKLLSFDKTKCFTLEPTSSFDGLRKACAIYVSRLPPSTARHVYRSYRAGFPLIG